MAETKKSKVSGLILTTKKGTKQVKEAIKKGSE